MRAPCGKNGFNPACMTVGTMQTIKKTRNRARTDRHMASDFNVSRSQFPWHHRNLLAGRWHLNKEQIRWQQFAKAAVNLRDHFR